MQRLIYAVFGPEYEPHVFCCRDDLIVTEDFESHLALLREVFRKLREANLSINFKKSELVVPEAIFLGFRVSKDGVGLDKGRIAPILKLPVPKTRKQCKSFVACCPFTVNTLRTLPILLPL